MKKIYSTGEAGEARTPAPLLKRQLLYRLSYSLMYKAL